MNDEINKSWLDRQTKIDDLLLEQIKATHDTNATLSSIATALSTQLPVKRHEEANYPLSGKKSLPVNETAFFNIKEGNVTFSSAADTEYLTQPISDTLCHSIYIYTDRTIDIELYEEDRPELTTSIFPIQWRKIYVDFNTIKIKTTAPTNIYLIVSTEPEGVPEVNLAEYHEGNPYVRRNSITAAGTPETFNINVVIGENAHTGTVSNTSVASDLYVELSSDGTTFTDSIILYPQQGLDLEDEDVHSIRIDASANATPYQIIAH